MSTSEKENNLKENKEDDSNNDLYKALTRIRVCALFVLLLEYTFLTFAVFLNTGNVEYFSRHLLLVLIIYSGSALNILIWRSANVAQAVGTTIIMIFLVLAFAAKPFPMVCEYLHLFG